MIGTNRLMKQRIQIGNQMPDRCPIGFLMWRNSPAEQAFCAISKADDSSATAAFSRISKAFADSI